MGTLRLRKRVTITGTVKDEDGKPIAGARLSNRMTDPQGRFTLQVSGQIPQFQLNVRKLGYVPLVGNVIRTDGGVRYVVATGGDKTDPVPAKELSIVLKRAGRFEGRVVDAETNEPVRLDKAVVGHVTRKPNGEPVVNYLHEAEAETPNTEPGRFQALYYSPDEYRLTFVASGYHDADVFMPKVAGLETVGGIVVKLNKKAERTTPSVARQTIAGKVTRGGQPVPSGWVGLWALRKPAKAPNSPVMRGPHGRRGPDRLRQRSILEGAFTLNVPFQGEDWYVVAEEAGHALTQVGPIAVALNEKKTLDIACTEGGRIRGRVTKVPPEWEGNVWVVAYSKTAVRGEVRRRAGRDVHAPAVTRRHVRPEGRAQRV